MSPEKTRIFISHAWEDKPLVRRLEKELQAAGVETWVDDSRTRGGDNLPKRISDALEWCNTLLLIWSDAATKSPWVELEWTNAISLRKNIIPCKKDETQLPGILAHKLYIDFHDVKAGIEGLLNAFDIKKHDGPKLDSLEIPEPASPPKEEKDNTSDESRDEKEAKSRTGREQTATKAQPVQEQREKPPPLERSRKTRFRFNKKRIGIGLLLGVLLLSVISLWQGWIDSPLYLLYEEAETMIVDKGFYDRDKNQGGEGVKNQYTPITVGTDKTVADGATGLTWQRGGSEAALSFEQTQGYIGSLNDQRFAGFADWRLPTLEEAMSLMEPKKNEAGLHIDRIGIAAIYQAACGVGDRVNVRIFQRPQNALCDLLT
ncbi:TIR domain-containing protein [candidate division KSB1 bacterium]|nr:TIR domain-containing protein [candidate division KSB1 bacterium]